MKKTLQIHCEECDKFFPIPATSLGGVVTCAHCKTQLDTSPVESAAPEPRQKQIICSFCQEPGHNRTSCELRKYISSVEEADRQREQYIEKLRKSVARHNDKVTALKLKHAMAIQAFELKWKSQQAEPFLVKHWPKAAALCGGAVALGTQHFDMIPYPEVVVPVSMACTIGLLLFFVFWTLRAMFRRTNKALDLRQTTTESWSDATES